MIDDPNLGSKDLLKVCPWQMGKWTSSKVEWPKSYVTRWQGRGQTQMS